MRSRDIKPGANYLLYAPHHGEDGGRLWVQAVNVHAVGDRAGRPATWACVLLAPDGAPTKRAVHFDARAFVRPATAHDFSTPEAPDPNLNGYVEALDANQQAKLMVEQFQELGIEVEVVGSWTHSNVKAPRLSITYKAPLQAWQQWLKLLRKRLFNE